MSHGPQNSLPAFFVCRNYVFGNLCLVHCETYHNLLLLFKDTYQSSHQLRPVLPTIIDMFLYGLIHVTFDLPFWLFLFLCHLPNAFSDKVHTVPIGSFIYNFYHPVCRFRLTLFARRSHSSFLS